MHAKLVVVAPKEHSGEHTLTLPALLGRGREATLKLLHPLISRKHCEIRQSGDHLIVRDLGSLNGTFIGRQRVEGQADLGSGDLLTLGGVTLRAVYEHRGGTLGSADATTLLGDATVSNLREAKVVPNQLADESDDLALESGEERGYSPAAMETDWLADSATSGGETQEAEPAADEALREKQSFDEALPDNEADESFFVVDDDLPAISFDGPEASTSSNEPKEAEFDPLEFLDSPAKAIAGGEPATTATDELESMEFEPVADRDVAPRADQTVVAANEGDDIELEPLDIPDDTNLTASDDAAWDVSEDDTDDQRGEGEPPSGEKSGPKSEDDDLDDFLKGLK